MPTRRLFLASGLAAAAAPALSLPAAGAEPTGEATVERIQRAKLLRVAAAPVEAPFFFKEKEAGKGKGGEGDEGWSGLGVEMAKSIAADLGVRLDLVEPGKAGALAELEAGKLDLALVANPTPKLALGVALTAPFGRQRVGLFPRRGLRAETWAEIDKPEIKISFENGSIEQELAHRLAPNATMIGFRNREEAAQAAQSGRADAFLSLALPGLVAIKKAPQPAAFVVLRRPAAAMPACFAVRAGADRRWRDFLDAWIQYNRGLGRMHEWLVAGLAGAGLAAADIPPEAEL